MSYGVIALVGFALIYFLWQFIKYAFLKSAKRAVVKKIKNVAEDFEVVDLEGKLQKAESKLHEAKDKLLNKSEG